MTKIILMLEQRYPVSSNHFGETMGKTSKKNLSLSVSVHIHACILQSFARNVRGTGVTPTTYAKYYEKKMFRRNKLRKEKR